jgi:dienelactone hydrolase
VLPLTYGSRDDRHRPEFAAQAKLKTEPVDASKLLESWDGLSGGARTSYWGFDAQRLPLNGRVWYPDGPGPFPLVLIVHGNHDATDFSDPGYQYLGELLASRGYILVSIDENFLNSMVTDLFAGLESENNVRAWLLLEHLRVWHAWNDDEQNPFHRKVDTDRIALIGHSRGGEAVAHAAAFNRLPASPDNGLVKFDFGYRIRSLIAIAPADGQYKPAGTWTPLEDVNYLVLQGSHDSDVSSFLGLYQYDRVTFTGDGHYFKSAVYVYGANHGQFNTSWGAYDVGVGLTAHFINTTALLPEADQLQIAEVYISAFLDCTLRDRREYEPLFKNHRAGSAWLPDTVYLTQYANSETQPLCAYDEDLNLATITSPGGIASMQNLTLWREGPVELRAGPTRDRAAFLGWDRKAQAGEPSYTISWPTGAMELPAEGVLTFCLADADEDPTPDDAEDEDDASEESKAEDKPEDGPRQPIDLTLEVTDADGHTAALPLRHHSALQPQIKTGFLKSELLHVDSLSEAIFQTFFFPLADFRSVNADLNLATIRQLRLIFDQTESGVVILDKVAVQSPPR